MIILVGQYKETVTVGIGLEWIGSTLTNGRWWKEQWKKQHEENQGGRRQSVGTQVIKTKRNSEDNSSFTLIISSHVNNIAMSPFTWNEQYNGLDFVVHFYFPYKLLSFQNFGFLTMKISLRNDSLL